MAERIHVIGAGGTGAWVLMALARMAPVGSEIVVWDRDLLEEKNADRQLYTLEEIKGRRNKALAITDKLSQMDDRRHYTAMARWFMETDAQTLDAEVVIACPDNHKARLAVLLWADTNPDRLAVLTGNGYDTAEAYVYKGGWRGKPADPRVRYPEMLTDKAGDVTACTGSIVDEKPQLAVANMAAAAFAIELWWWWTCVRPTMPANDPQINAVETIERRWSGNMIRNLSRRDLFNEHSEQSR